MAAVSEKAAGAGETQSVAAAAVASTVAVSVKAAGARETESVAAATA